MGARHPSLLSVPNTVGLDFCLSVCVSQSFRFGIRELTHTLRKLRGLIVRLALAGSPTCTSLQ